MAAHGGKQGGRPPKLLKCFGAELTLAEWSKESGISAFTIRNRIKAGWSVKDALVYPRGERPPGRPLPGPKKVPRGTASFELVKRGGRVFVRTPEQPSVRAVAARLTASLRNARRG